MRINKYLSEMGICSRREADRLIEAGRVKIDGRLAKMGENVEGQNQVYVDEKRVGQESDIKKVKPILIAVNKPVGIVCTTSTKDRAKNIVEMVGFSQRIYPIGRLDKDSRGLILMTNQGDLVNKIMRAANFHEKEYIVRVNQPLSEEFQRQMEMGVWLSELRVRTRRCRVKILSKDTFSIVLTQGLNRQIRRMCEELGYQVRDLERVRIMNILLGNLLEGSYRELSKTEQSQLKKMLQRGRENG
jgi:pseudouridylate synthase